MIQPQRLTEEQILRLLARYRRMKDSAARDKLVMQYRNLVESVARRFAGANEPVEDLAQEGYIGLISAVEGFDASKGVKFSTYATHFVIGQIKHYLRDKGKIIKEPAWLQELNQRMTRVIESLSQQFGRQPTDAEIAKIMKIREEDVSDLLMTREVFKVSSLDGDRDDNNNGSNDAEKAKHQKLEVFQLPIEDRLVLETSVERLKEIEQRVIHEYFFRDLNQTEIARKLGISCNYVSHILRNSTRKLRKILTTEDIREMQIQLQTMQRRGVQDSADPSSRVVDAATDLYTRSYFLARLEEELSRGTRYHYPVCIMLVTLEYMSDREHGWVPMAIDERLYKIASSIRGRVRKSDIVARFSDNQFALILPHAGSLAANVCQRIKAIVEDISSENPGDPLEMRAELRFAAYPEDAGNVADLLRVLERPARKQTREPVTEKELARAA